ncbi:MAG: hypothetical protein QXU88_00965 [Candidatus Woesearchaeota archaeon]
MVINGRKGVVGELLVAFLSFAGLALTILLFTFIFSPADFPGPQTLTVLNEGETDGKLRLLTILRSPVVFDGEKIDFADMIALWQGKQEPLESILHSELEKLLNNKLSYEFEHAGVKFVRTYAFAIYSIKDDLSRGKELMKVEASGYSGGKEIASTHVALKDGNVLEVVLFSSAQKKPSKTPVSSASSIPIK